LVYGSAVADGEEHGGEPEADAAVEAEAEVEGGEQVADVAGEVREVSGGGWPAGYVYGATRYADVILAQSFPDRFKDLVAALDGFHPTLDELRAGGGGRTVFVRRFDESLAEMKGPGDEVVWGKQNVTIEKSVGLDNTIVRSSRVRGHEIDMFGKGTLDEPLPGIAVEMEWNNKDPFFDRDLINFQALHHEGAIAIGVIVTRGPGLQDLIESTIRSKDGGFKFGSSTTHWRKLIPKVNLGGGGECPLLLIGIEPERIDGVALAVQVKAALEEADAFKQNWRDTYDKWTDAKPVYDQMRTTARDLMPPVADDGGGDEE
jgi:hypothetical protein